MAIISDFFQHGKYFFHWLFLGEKGWLHVLVLIAITSLLGIGLSKFLSTFISKKFNQKKKYALHVFVPILTRLVLFTMLFIGVMFSLQFITWMPNQFHRYCN